MSNDRFGVGGQGGQLGDSYDSLYLDMLVDVKIGTPTNQYVLTYNSTTEKWEPQPAGAGADTKTYVFENGVQVGTVSRYVNFDGTDFNVTENAGSDWFLIELAGGVVAHDLTGSSHTEDATGGVGNVLRASGATAFAWAQLGHGDLDSVTSDQHHAQQHTLSGADHTGDLAYTQIDAIVDIAGVGANNLLSRADHVHTDLDGSSKVTYTNLSSIPSTFAPTAHILSGADHTASGLTIGHAIMADSATSFSWQAPSYYTSFTTDFAAESLANLTTRNHGSLSDAPADAHHSETHTLATSGVHTDTLPFTDLEVGTQGSIIRRGAADWEELTKGTTNYALVAGATDVAWAQYDYTWLANIPSTFSPSSHGSSAHTGNVFPAASQNLGTQYMDIGAIAAPTDPGANVRRIFLDSGTGKVSVRTNASTTVSLEEQGGTDADAIHDNVADEINQIADKASPVGADVLIIEDSAGAGWAKKKVSITNLPGGADADAIHDNVADEIHQIALKGAPVSADEIVIEDSVNSWNKKRVTISSLPAGSPSFGLPVSIDIGDAQAEGTSGDSARADHQHAFVAPGAGYPLDVGDTESDGTATTPARSDHIHAHGSRTNANAHRWNDLAAVPNTTTTTIGKATPTAVVLGVGHNGTAVYCNTFYIADHAHTSTAGTGNQVDYTDLANIPSTFTPEAHVLGTSGPHSGTLPLADLAVGSQGSIIRRGGTDWEEYTKGTLNYALVCTSTDAVWAQYDYSWLANIPSTFAPTSHGASDHTGDVLPAANQDLGAYYLDIDDIGVPANPGATIRRLFVNTADGKLSVRTNGGVTVSLEEQGGGVTWGTPTGNIDIGDGAVEGTSGDATRADHQHAFTAPTAGYPLDTANAEADGSATTPARSDHVHRLGAHIHTATAGEGGILTWANVLSAAAAGDHDHSDNTKGSAVPEASITFSATGHDHDGTGSENVSYANLDSVPSTFTPSAHQLDSATFHTVSGLTTGQYLRAASATTFAFQARTFTVSATLKSPEAGYTTVWRAPVGCTCTKLEGRQKGGTSTVINCRYNGTTDVATADLTLTAANQWYSTTGINQTAWSATDWLEIEVVTVASATEITFVLTFTEP